MATNFTSLWSTAWSLIYKLLNLPLPIYFGSTALTFMDLIIGTIGILVAFASIRALLHSGFSVAGKDLVSEYKHQEKIRQLNAQTRTEFENRQQGIAYIEGLKKDGKL